MMRITELISHVSPRWGHYIRFERAGQTCDCLLCKKYGITVAKVIFFILHGCDSLTTGVVTAQSANKLLHVWTQMVKTKLGFEPYTLRFNAARTVLDMVEPLYEVPDDIWTFLLFLMLDPVSLYLRHYRSYANKQIFTITPCLYLAHIGWTVTTTSRI